MNIMTNWAPPQVSFNSPSHFEGRAISVVFSRHVHHIGLLLKFCLLVPQEYSISQQANSGWHFGERIKLFDRDSTSSCSAFFSYLKWLWLEYGVNKDGQWNYITFADHIKYIQYFFLTYSTLQI